jgi:hypothetical protein
MRSDLTVDVVFECYWPRTASGACGELGYSCNEEVGSRCCAGLVCTDNYCVPPDWIDPSANISVPEACGVPLAYPCGMQAEMNLPVGLCELDLSGFLMSADAGTTNVIIVRSDASDDEFRYIPHVRGPEGCTSSGGWYLDGVDPRTAHICSASCDCAKQFASGFVVAVGCATYRG